MATSTVEDYLKTILSLSPQDGAEDRVALGRVAGSLRVTPGTVTTMAKHLAGRGLVDYQLRQGVKLTQKGRVAALAIVRRHRLLEQFLVEVMGLDWADVHPEAEALEHAVSDRLVERMDELLGDPLHDPHGDPIPSVDGDLPRVNTSPLSDCEPGDYRLVRVLEDSTGFLSWLTECGLVPGSSLSLRSIDRYGEVATLQPQGRSDAIQIGINAAAKLLVVRQT